MALARDLEIYKSADALFQFALKLQVQIPRAHRVSLGLPLSSTCGAILLSVSRANVSRDAVREGHIQLVLEHLESAMSFFRAAHQMHILTHKVWADSIELTDAVGKQANGWLKSTRNFSAAMNLVAAPALSTACKAYLTSQKRLCYSPAVSAKKALIGCESPKARGQEPHHRTGLRLFCSRPIFGGPNGRAQALPVTLRVPRSLTPVRAAAQCESWSAVVHLARLEINMTNAAPGATAPLQTPEPDYRFSGFCYQNWSMDGPPPLIVNPEASLHHKLAWLWGEVSLLNDAVLEMNCGSDKPLRIFANFVSSRLMPMEAMLDHLGDITSRGEEP